MHDGKLLTREIAERFLEDEHAVDLPGCTAIETAAAEILSKYRGDLDLDLDGLTSLSDAAAKSFREFNSGLSLNGLTELSCAAAQSHSRSERLQSPASLPSRAFNLCLAGVLGCPATTFLRTNGVTFWPQCE